MLTEEQRQKIEIENQKISDNIHKIKYRIAVFSGKGGVGKTMLSVNLAYAFHHFNKRTGILDADVTGPNVPKMLGLNGNPRMKNNLIYPQIKNGVKVISIASMLPENQPLIWRGPMRSKLLNQFLGDVVWGKLDYLIADLPPGTGDEIITITQKMQPDLAIIVTTPQEVALLDSSRAINMAKKIQIPNIAVVENMSGLICPHCGQQIDLFGIGGGEKQAKQFDVLFLGRIPMEIDVRILSDAGRSIIIEKSQCTAAVAMIDIADRINQMFYLNQAQL